MPTLLAAHLIRAEERKTELLWYTYFGIRWGNHQPDRINFCNRAYPNTSI